MQGFERGEVQRVHSREQQPTEKADTTSACLPSAPVLSCATAQPGCTPPPATFPSRHPDLPSHRSHLSCHLACSMLAMPTTCSHPSYTHPHPTAATLHNPLHSSSPPHLSRAYSMLAMPTACSPALAACRAATLTRLARSAPLKPGVPRAMVCRSTSGAKGMFCRGLGSSRWERVVGASWEGGPAAGWRVRVVSASWEGGAAQQRTSGVRGKGMFCRG